MTREIKFRAWDNKYKIMLTHFHIVNSSEDGEDKILFVTYPNENPNHPFEKSDYILMQYTGLQDKNGVEIYEGDIVKNERHEFITEIEYYGGAFRCKSEGMPLSLYIDECYGGKELNNQLEVIGNIYENKELNI